MSSLVILFGILLACHVYDPRAFAFVKTAAGLTWYPILVLVGTWATLFDIQAWATRKLFRRISKDPNLYIDQ